MAHRDIKWVLVLSGVHVLIDGSDERSYILEFALNQLIDMTEKCR